MKVLLVDDDLVSRKALIQMLELPAGSEIIEVANGKEALELLSNKLRPDFCVVDLMMPEMSGIDLLKKMRIDQELRNIKVVVTSASRDKEVISSLAKLQVSGYLLKPYDQAKANAILKPLVAGVSVSLAPSKNIKKSLLAVDDDPVIRTAITEFVSQNPGWEVKLAVDGNDAFDCLYAGLRPDLILTDLTMPNADGLTLVNRIRKDRNFENMKVAIISGDKDREKIKELAKLNIFAYLLKPFDAKQITSLLSKAAGM